MRVQVNEKGMINNLSRTFSSTHSWLTEFLQNARRAGAKNVSIEYAPDLRIVEFLDDGKGIEFWDSLLTVAESAWDPESNENPFGMGFFAGLFISRRMLIQSRGKSIKFDSDLLLAGAEVPLKDCKFTGPGTRINMHLKSEEIIDEKVFLDAVRGLGLNVKLNGELLPAPHRPKGEYQHLKDLGHISKGFFDARKEPMIIYYYQGIAVDANRTCNWITSKEKNEAYCLHLDNKYEVKLPDRNRLKNHEATIKLINERLKTEKELWLRGKLKDCMIKASSEVNGHVEFVKCYWNHIKGWYLTPQFNDLLAAQYALYRIEDTPRFSRYAEDDNILNWAVKDQVVVPKDSGGFSVDVEHMRENDVDLFGVLALMEAKNCKFYPTHSPKSAYVLDQDAIKVGVVGEVKPKNAFKPKIIFAKEIWISLDEKFFEDGHGIDAEWFEKTLIDFPFYHEDIIYFPIKSDPDYYYLARQMSAFYRWEEYSDNSEFDEEACDRFTSSLQHYIAFNLSDGDEKSYLLSCLNNKEIPEKFDNKVITVRLGMYNSFKEVLKIEEENK